MDSTVPPSTAVPMAWRLAAPGPVPSASGSTPKPKASEVIRMGRRRRRTASSVASKMLRPWSCSCTANSTIRMAFLDASPTVVNSPTWKYTSLDMPRKYMASKAPTMPSGTARMTENGTLQLS